MQCMWDVMEWGCEKIIYHELHHPGSMCLFRLFLLSCNRNKTTGFWTFHPDSLRPGDQTTPTAVIWWGAAHTSCHVVRNEG